MSRVNKEMLDDAADCIKVARTVEDPMDRIAACLAAGTSLLFVATNILCEETKLGGAFHTGHLHGGTQTGRFKRSG